MDKITAKDQAPTMAGYNYLHPLGEGGFADVYLYTQNTPRRNVAIKALKSEINTNEIRQTFLTEGNIIAKLTSHPNIISLYDVSVSSDGRPYIAMEVCKESLLDRVVAEGALPISDVLSAGIKMCDALNMAHSHGLLHRDIKPSNIMYNEIGNLVLSDFGIAIDITHSELSRGFSEPWAAPEILDNRTNGTIATDVYGIGITLFFITYGFNPKLERGVKRKDVPTKLAALIESCVNSNPGRRPSSMIEVIQQLSDTQKELGLPLTEYANIETVTPIEHEENLENAFTKKYTIPTKNTRHYQNTLTNKTASDKLKNQIEKRRWQIVSAVVAILFIAIVVLLGIILTQ
jgi:serine/threonine protein kinase